MWIERFTTTRETEVAIDCSTVIAVEKIGDTDGLNDLVNIRVPGIDYTVEADFEKLVEYIKRAKGQVS